MGFPKVVVIGFTCHYVRRIRRRASIRYLKTSSVHQPILNFRKMRRKQVLTKILSEIYLKQAKIFFVTCSTRHFHVIFENISVYLSKTSVVPKLLVAHIQVLGVGQILLIKII